MKIAWFTPFYCRSAIGQYSKYAAEALSKLPEIEIDIFTAHKKDLHETFLRVISFDSVSVTDKLSDYDICIYNMGDYADYHVLIYDVLKIHPGIVISHDVCMHNFMRGYYIIYKNDENGYINLLKATYEEKEIQMILQAGNDVEKWSKLDLVRYNLAESIYENTLGVVVHSNYHKAILEKCYFNMINVVPLLYKGAMNSKTHNDIPGFDDTKLNILTVGNVNPNKKIDSVIRIIGTNDYLKKNVHYTVIGSHENNKYLSYLNEIIKKYGLEDNVRLLGFVEDELLEDYYFHADIITNLRYPALEGGSASLVEQLTRGKAVVVSDTGVYSELPDDVVFKIGIETEEKDLETMLVKVIDSPDLLADIKKRAREFADNYYSEEVYAEKLLSFIKQVLFLLPLNAGIDYCKGMIDLMGPNVQKLSWIDRLAENISCLYGV